MAEHSAGTSLAPHMLFMQAVMTSRFVPIRFSIRRLRRGGARLRPEYLTPYGTMYLRAERPGGVVCLYATIERSGAPIHKLYEPKLVRAESDIMVFQGIERAGDAAFVQAWELRSFRPILADDER